MLIKNEIKEFSMELGRRVFRLARNVNGEFMKKHVLRVMRTQMSKWIGINFLE